MGIIVALAFFHIFTRLARTHTFWGKGLLAMCIVRTTAPGRLLRDT